MRQNIIGLRSRAAIYNFIIDFIKEHKYSPTIREICIGTGLKSSSTVWNQLETLKEQGLIDYQDTSPRTITVKGYEYTKVE